VQAQTGVRASASANWKDDKCKCQVARRASASANWQEGKCMCELAKEQVQA
jgi:hypothetical protein